MIYKYVTNDTEKLILTSYTQWFLVNEENFPDQTKTVFPFNIKQIHIILSLSSHVAHSFDFNGVKEEAQDVIRNSDKDEMMVHANEEK